MGVGERILERLAEVEAEASKRKGTAYETWHYEPDGLGRAGGRVVGNGAFTEVVNDWHGSGFVDVAAHIALNDPAHVLRLVAALRAVVELHEPVDPCDAHDASMRSVPCDTLLAIAAIWADAGDGAGGEL